MISLIWVYVLYISGFNEQVKLRKKLKYLYPLKYYIAYRVQRILYQEQDVDLPSYINTLGTTMCVYAPHMSVDVRAAGFLS